MRGPFFGIRRRDWSKVGENVARRGRSEPMSAIQCASIVWDEFEDRVLVMNNERRFEPHGRRESQSVLYHSFERIPKATTARIRSPVAM